MFTSKSSIVRTVWRKSDGNVFVAKAVQEDSTSARKPRREISIMRRLDHPAILKLVHSFSDHSGVVCILPRMSGGDMSNHLGAMALSEIQTVLARILGALEHMHARGFVHCDIKPENVVLATSGDFASATLCDFDLATPIGEQVPLIGTSPYIAPEAVAFASTAEPPRDMWSLGVCAFAMITGLFLFDPDNEDCFEHIESWKGLEHHEGVPEDAEQFMWELLRHRPDLRPTASEALRRPWITARTALAHGSRVRD